MTQTATPAPLTVTSGNRAHVTVVHSSDVDVSPFYRYGGTEQSIDYRPANDCHRCGARAGHLCSGRIGTGYSGRPHSGRILEPIVEPAPVEVPAEVAAFHAHTLPEGAPFAPRTAADVERDRTAEGDVEQPVEPVGLTLDPSSLVRQARAAGVGEVLAAPLVHDREVYAVRLHTAGPANARRVAGWALQRGYEVATSGDTVTLMLPEVDEPAPATVERYRAPSGNRDEDRFRAVHPACGWRSLAWHSNRTVEGRRLAARDARQHRCVEPESDNR